MTDDDASGHRPRRIDRRAFLGTAALGTITATAGCVSSLPGLGDDDGGTELALSDFRGSGPFAEDRPTPEGTSMADLDDLSGSLSIYIGGGEGGLYRGLVELLSKKYPDFDPSLKSAPSTQLANTINQEQEGGQSRGDVFWSIDASSLGLVANAGNLTSLGSDVVEPVPSELRDGKNRWVGVAGRARAIPYNTNEFSEGDIPDSVDAFATDSAFSDAMGWAPTYGAFKSFVTAMRLRQGRDATKSWLQGMLDNGVEEFRDEFFVSRGVATGDIAAGFANHYYALRVRAAREDPPLDLAFTSGDAGALVNVSGMGIIDGTDAESLAELFAQHLLTAEAQEFFATRAYSYPMIDGVQPVGGLPTIGELNPPDIDLTELSDLEPTLELMREVGVL